MKRDKGRQTFAGALSLLGLAFLIPSASISTAAQGKQPNASPEIAFTVSMPKPHTHLLDVEVRIKHGASDQAAKEAVLVMPVWTPGSYLIREFERHVQDFAAVDAAGKPLPWEKINKNSWRIVTGGSREWRATYRVYANELSVRTNEVNSEHAFWNNADAVDVSRRFAERALDAARAGAAAVESRNRTAARARSRRILFARRISTFFTTRRLKSATSRRSRLKSRACRTAS